MEFKITSDYDEKTEAEDLCKSLSDLLKEVKSEPSFEVTLEIFDKVMQNFLNNSLTPNDIEWLLNKTSRAILFSYKVVK